MHWSAYAGRIVRNRNAQRVFVQGFRPFWIITGSVAKTMNSTFANRLTAIPMAEFALKWRFTDPKFHVLPPIHLEQIHPLDAPSAGLIWQFILDSNVHAVDPFQPGFFRHHETTAIGDSHGNQEEDSRIRKWLYRCAIPFDHQIFLSWQPTWTVRTTWKMLVKYWTSFYYWYQRLRGTRFQRVSDPQRWAGADGVWSVPPLGTVFF
jgi:hypothetical protein